MHFEQPFRRVFATILLCIIFVATLGASAVNAQTPSLNKTLLLESSDVEVLQAEATLQYHTGDYNGAVATLKRIINGTQFRTKHQLAALELLALSFKQLKDEVAAAGVYRRLLATGDQKELPSYHFELGTIRIKAKNYNYDETKTHFESSLEGYFNPGTSHFFLGLLAMKDENLQLAFYHFASAQHEKDSEQLMPAIRYYMSMTLLQLGKTETAIRHLKEIEVLDEKMKSNPIAVNSTKGAQAILKKLNSAEFFGSIGLISQLDTNVQSNPISVTNTSGATNQRSFKEVLNVSLTYSTSPFNRWQFTPTYNLYGNYNFNNNTRDFNFASHTLGIYTFYKPYERFAKGFKAQTTYSMKNTGKNGATLYTKYSIAEEIGPIVKYALSSRSFLTGELYWTPHHFYSDPKAGINRRSGQGLLARTSVDFISASRFWSPTGALSFVFDDTNGTAYDMTSFGIGLSNNMRLTKKLGFMQSFDSNFSDYYASNPRRNDKYLSGTLAFNYALIAKIRMNVDGTYIYNLSTIPNSYKYTRFLASLGFTYSL